MYDKIVQYIASKEFAEGVKTSPAILNYAYRPYWEVDPDVPAELKTSEVSTDIENARLRLAEAYENITIDQKTIVKTLQLDLATNRQQELVGLATKLQTDAENVQKAALICFSDLEACVSNTNRILGGVVAYDRKIIEPNPFIDGLIAYYPFNSNALDESGNDHHGTVNGATLTEDRFSKTDGAYYFDGVDDYIDCGNNTILNGNWNGVSLSAWIKPYSHIAGVQQIVGKWAVSIQNDHYALFIHGNRLVIAVSDGARPEGGGYGKTILKPNNWYHVVGVWKNNREYNVYVNGIIEGTQTGYGMNKNSPIALKIGRQKIGVNRAFHGIIDDVSVYNRALSDSEIQQLYNNASNTTNQTNNCKANLLDKKLEIPCVSVPNVIVGGADIYSVDLINTPFSKRFDVDLNTLKKHTFQDSCLAKYNFNTGSLNLPCVNVPNDRDYVMKMQQRSGTLVFDLIDSQ